MAERHMLWMCRYCIQGHITDVPRIPGRLHVLHERLQTFWESSKYWLRDALVDMWAGLLFCPLVIRWCATGCRIAIASQVVVEDIVG